jgi:hypothetical protein
MTYSLLFAVAIALVAPLVYGNVESKLKTDLLKDYDKDIRPVKDYKTVTEVTLEPSIRAVISWDEKTKVISFLEYFRMYWMDEYLSYDSANYEGLEQLHLPTSAVWMPDIGPNDEVDGHSTEFPYTVRVKPDGKVTTDKSVRRDLVCKLYSMSGSAHNCTVGYGSWYFSAEQIKVASLPYRTDEYNKGSGGVNLITVNARQVITTYSQTGQYVEVNYDFILGEGETAQPDTTAMGGAGGEAAAPAPAPAGGSDAPAPAPAPEPEAAPAPAPAPEPEAAPAPAPAPEPEAAPAPAPAPEPEAAPAPAPEPEAAPAPAPAPAPASGPGYEGN